MGVAGTSATEAGEMLLRADGLEVEYQVPTSSQRDQEDDITLVDSEEEEEEEDEEGLPDDGVSTYYFGILIDFFTLAESESSQLAWFYWF